MGPDYELPVAPAWVPRSTTLPRRPIRPVSSINCQAPQPLPTYEVSSARSSPSHSLRQQPTIDTSRQVSAIYANPYRTMAQTDNKTIQHHHETLKTDSYRQKNMEELYSNYNGHIQQATPVEVGLPPRPPPPHELTHRRTLSSSPRRVPCPPQAGTSRQHLSPHRQIDRTRRQLTSSRQNTYHSTTLHRQTLSSSHNAVYDSNQFLHHNDINKKYPSDTIHLSHQVDYPQLINHQKFDARECSPKRKQQHTSPHRILRSSHQSPSRQKKDNIENERFNNDRRLVSQLSTSLDSGILPDHRSLPHDSSDDKPVSDSSEHPSQPAYNKAALQLDLVSSHMNNIIRNPPISQQSDPPLKTNKIFSDINNISKRSDGDTISKNLGYTDTNKCEKKLYVSNVPSNIQNTKQSKNSKLSIKHIISPTMKKALRSKQITLKKSEVKNPPPSLKHNGEKLERVHDDRVASPVSPSKGGIIPITTKDAPTECSSVRTYPSLSELNFCSLAAQKILHGVSVNSIDTLLEVNLAAGEGPKLKIAEPVTNTDFGYL